MIFFPTGWFIYVSLGDLRRPCPVYTVGLILAHPLRYGRTTGLVRALPHPLDGTSRWTRPLRLRVGPPAPSNRDLEITPGTPLKSHLCSLARIRLMLAFNSIQNFIVDFCAPYSAAGFVPLLLSSSCRLSTLSIDDASSDVRRPKPAWPAPPLPVQSSPLSSR
jgi:hypothetical protein